MEDCVDVIDILSELLLKSKLAGDPIDTMPYEHMTLIVSKQHGHDLSNLLYTTDYGAIQFPEIVFINTVPHCVESKVCHRGQIFLTLVTKSIEITQALHREFPILLFVNPLSQYNTTILDI